ncbi:MAG: rhodanese-like domain-containing protein [Opitutaceae bacterium]|jgi:rhodanese-related sulfurtransferase
MKIILIVAVILIAFILIQRVFAGGVVTPEEAAKRVTAGTAVLIDVREPDEWTDGVVMGALLLPLSDLRGERTKWRSVLEANRDKELIFYCRSGTRAGMAAELLAKEGFKTANAGGFGAWKKSGQPTSKPAATRF